LSTGYKEMLARVRAVLTNSPKNLRLSDIASSTGVSSGYLSEFRRGRIKNPDPVWTERVYHYLRREGHLSAARIVGAA